MWTTYGRIMLSQHLCGIFQSKSVQPIVNLRRLSCVEGIATHIFFVWTITSFHNVKQHKTHRFQKFISFPTITNLYGHGIARGGWFDTDGGEMDTLYGKPGGMQSRCINMNVLCKKIGVRANIGDVELCIGQTMVYGKGIATGARVPKGSYGGGLVVKNARFFNGDKSWVAIIKNDFIFSTRHILPHIDPTNLSGGPTSIGVSTTSPKTVLVRGTFKAMQPFWCVKNSRRWFPYCLGLLL